MIIGKREHPVFWRENEMAGVNLESEKTAEGKGPNESQEKAVHAVHGPVLITAGPGTGKTYTLVQRTVYLIEHEHMLPENILIVTFTDKAAAEITSRLYDALAASHPDMSLNSMYIGTFHSVCLKILQEYPNESGIGKDCRILDESDLRYFIGLHYWDFFGRNWEDGSKRIPGLQDLFDNSLDKHSGYGTRNWKRAGVICRICSHLIDEMVPEDELIQSDLDGGNVRIIGQMLAEYKKLLAENNCLDYSLMQAKCLELLKNNREVYRKITNQIHYVMVDEFQDTSAIQNQLAFLLAGPDRNICVVGDDDQALYRFRGATTRNMLSFPRDRVINLDVNYRSFPGIIAFYTRFITGIPELQDFRTKKELSASENHRADAPKAPQVYQTDIHAYKEELPDLVLRLKKEGKIRDCSQIAVLYYSTKSDEARALAASFENHGIPVYSPRSGMFFERDEVKALTAALLRSVPEGQSYSDLIYGQKDIYHHDEKSEFIDYLDQCNEVLTDLSGEGFGASAETDDSKEPQVLKPWSDEGPHASAEAGRTAKTIVLKPLSIKELRASAEADDSRKPQVRKPWSDENHHASEETDGISTKAMLMTALYRVLQYAPFSDWLDQKGDPSSASMRSVRNIASYTSIVSRFELNYDEQHKDSSDRSDIREKVTAFLIYFYNQWKSGANEYEDDENPAVPGCVSFMTIHQAKGLEFPIVIVGSLKCSTWIRSHSDAENIIDRNWNAWKDQSEEDREKWDKEAQNAPVIDKARLLYTAFSRAENLLIVVNNSEREYPAIEALPPLSSFTGKGFEFASLKSSSVKHSYSFTSDVLSYEHCPLQYKYFHELGFARSREEPMVFGTLVHETVEDINKSVIDGQIPTPDMIQKWFDRNYANLRASTGNALDRATLQDAEEEVTAYCRAQEQHWDTIAASELDITRPESSHQEYMIEGRIDLVQKTADDRIRIVDFKTEKKPKKDAQVMENYRRQLALYADLAEKSTGKSVDEVALWFLSEKNENALVTFDCKKSKAPGDPENTVYTENAAAKFDCTIQKIISRQYDTCAEDRKICDSCDLKAFCQKTGKISTARRTAPAEAKSKPAPAADGRKVGQIVRIGGSDKKPFAYIEVEGDPDRWTLWEGDAASQGITYDILEQWKESGSITFRPEIRQVNGKSRKNAVDIRPR